MDGNGGLQWEEAHWLDERQTGQAYIVSAPEEEEEEEDEPARKLPPSRYKGVVPQRNHEWGAQIYEKHLRVWLGTFRTELEAALAHDVAARKFRGKEAITNFSAVWEDQHQARFLEAHSKDEIVDMLRRNAYHDELSMARRDGTAGASSAWAKRVPMPACVTEKKKLFDKVLTPSDIGKLNRLVIPKYHAEKFFPIDEGTYEGLLLNFEDEVGKIWRFKYSYLASSQCYVLTRGWRQFVKEKGLKVGDVATFLRSTGPEELNYIDWQHGRVEDNAIEQVGWCNCSPKLQPLRVQPQVSPQSVKLFGVDLIAQHI